jgi:hypothetical protein
MGTTKDGGAIVIMSGENARVEVRVCGDDNCFWVDNIVNGFHENLPIHAASIEHAEKMAPEVEKLIKSLYRKAYRDGYFSCQSVIKDALGIPRNIKIN